MKGRRSLGIAAVGVALGLWALAGPVLAANGAVRIGEADERYFFRPTTVYANAGGSVTWTNGTDAQHTVTSDSGSELGSAAFGEDETFSHTFAATGTFAYHCTIHDYMTGKVIVLAAGVALPATDTDAATAALGTNGGLTAVGLVILASVAAAGLAIRRLRRTT